MAGDPRALVQQAEKQLKAAGGGFALFGGREEKYEKAADMYKEAANAYRLQKQGREAGRTYEAAARIQLENLKEDNDAANSWMEAAKCYQMDRDADNAVRLLRMAADQFLAKGNIRRGATQQAALAKIVKDELNDPARAAKEYEKAGELFNMDGNSSATVSNNWNEAAHQFGLAGDYPTAIKYFEQISRMARDSNTLKYSIPKWLLWAGFCHFAVGDHIATRRALDGYYAEFGQEFDRQRTQQCSLLEKLLEITGDTQGPDAEAWGAELGQWNQVHPMDNWEVEICTRVRKGLEAQGEDFS